MEPKESVKFLEAIERNQSPEETVLKFAAMGYDLTTPENAFCVYSDCLVAFQDYMKAICGSDSEEVMMTASLEKTARALKDACRSIAKNNRRLVPAFMELCSKLDYGSQTMIDENTARELRQAKPGDLITAFGIEFRLASAFSKPVECGAAKAVQFSEARASGPDGNEWKLSLAEHSDIGKASLCAISNETMHMDAPSVGVGGKEKSNG